MLISVKPLVHTDATWPSWDHIRAIGQHIRVQDKSFEVVSITSMPISELPYVYVDRQDYLERIATAKKHLKAAHRALSQYDKVNPQRPQCPCRLVCTCPRLPKGKKVVAPAKIKLPSNKTKYGRGAPFDDVL